MGKYLTVHIALVEDQDSVLSTHMMKELRPTCHLHRYCTHMVHIHTLSSDFFKNSFIFNHVYVPSMLSAGTQKGQKRVCDPLELELLVLVSP